MKIKLVIVSTLTLIMFGCSSSSQPPKTDDGYIGVGNVEYDSLYHYGYNIGCRSAGMVKRDTSLGSVESMKDDVLDGLSEFDRGWDAGTTACQDGISHSMYTVK
ncbi:hypothetical protein [Shewanella psychrotolerans]|uniref:hypothetical protein n=1 Tax=Shewanella psychrotolerans TaxID=2864206 RepID=UPI001C65644D|nr:hypothetical protein [Shewanella psychrotolerans]QYK02290.1 hypothetical protein K0I62_04770 [Shewanella psychrotolerans]